jgi:hypothetical protein
MVISFYLSMLLGYLDWLAGSFLQIIPHIGFFSTQLLSHFKKLHVATQSLLC